MKARYLKLILLLNNLVLAVSLTNCTRKRKDFETAKTVVARELRSPGTAHSCAFDEAEFSTRNGMHAVKLYVKTWPERFVRSGLVAGEKCVESAAEDEKQN